MQYTETQLSKLIEDVEREFTTHLAKAEETANAETVDEVVSEVLAKAEDKPEKKEAKPDEKAPESKEKPEAEAKPAAEAKPEGEAKAAAPGEEAEEAPPAAPAEGQAPPAAAAAPGAEGSGYDAEDMAHMQKMYASMSREELKAHHDCIAELAKCGDMSQGQAPGAPAPAAQENAPMAKSEEIKPVEVKAEEAAPTKEVDLLKSELGEANTKLATLQKNFDAVAAFLTKLVEKKQAPAAKAITSLDVIEKSEGSNEEKPLAKNDIHNILCKKSAEPSLKKSDRDAINVYYADGQVDIKGISHLLK